MKSENWINIEENIVEQSEFSDFNFLIQLLKWKPSNSLHHHYYFFINQNPKTLESLENYRQLSQIDKEYISKQYQVAVVSGKNINYAYKISCKNSIESKQFNLQQAIRYFNTPVFLVIENSLNDSYFLKSTFRFFDIEYSKQSRLLEFIDNDWIQFVNAGGWSNIKNYIEGRKKSLEKFCSLYGKSEWDFIRCFVLMDSDKKFPTDVLLDREKLKTELESLGIKVHILKKRAMENYMPDEVIEHLPEIHTKYNPFTHWINVYKTLSSEQKDFLNYQKGFPKKRIIENNKENVVNKERSEQIQQIQNHYPISSISDTNYNILDDGFQPPKFKDEFPKLFENSHHVYKDSLLKREGGTNEANEFKEIVQKINSLL